MKEILEKRDREIIAKTPYSHDVMVSKDVGTTSGQARQFTFADYGNTSGLNRSRADDPSGLARPVLLRGTSKHTNLFVQCSEFIKILSPYLGIPSDAVYVDPEYSDRHKDFQSVVHPDNIVEALRMALINCILKCACHRDIHNCNTVPGMMLVMVLSRFVLVNDVPCCSSVITYSRKIITTYGRKKSTPLNQLITDFATYYQHTDKLPRRVVNQSLFRKPNVPWKDTQVNSEHVILECF